MSHQLEVVRGDVLGRERLKMNHMLTYLYHQVRTNEASITELEETMSELVDLLKGTQEDLRDALRINNLHLEKITGEIFTEEDIDE